MVLADHTFNSSTTTTMPPTPPKVEATTSMLNRSTDSRDSAPITPFSVSSESSLVVPGKLYADINKLKSCYMDIIKLLDPNDKIKSATKTSSEVLMLTKDQILRGITKNKVNLPAVKNHLVTLLDTVRPVCLPNYQAGKCSPPGAFSFSEESQITSLVTRVETICNGNQSKLENLESELGSIKALVSNYEGMLFSASATKSSAPASLIEFPSDAAIGDHHLDPIERTVEDFVSEENSEVLTSALRDLPYVEGKGLSTMKFGENYKFNGSRGDSVEFPPYIKAILDDLNEKFVSPDTPALNSCLVTKYVGPNSYIAPHSDDERAIHPESSIFTISLGKEATVKFTDVHSGTVSEHKAVSGSLYCMSRKSQGLFKHAIGKDSSWEASDERISLTFRSLHWRNNNSTVVIGDSNTLGLTFAKFGKDAPTSGSYNGTFGNAMPGKQVEAYTVEELDPVKCVGFNNIVVHCGINSIRDTSITSDEEVKAIYVKFKSKIYQIMEANKRARVYVCTLLPTKLNDCKSKVIYFNKLILEDLQNAFSNIRIINTFSQFCDVRGLLATNLSRDLNKHGSPDYLHLDERGLRVLSIKIKQSIFYSKRKEESTGFARGGPGTGRGVEQWSDGGYAGALSRPAYRGRRGGPNLRGRDHRSRW